MDSRDKEALEMILERNGYHRTLVVMEEIQKEAKIKGWMEEGMSRQEAEDYLEQIWR